MKKLLAIALIATSFVACNNGETKEEPKTDSAAVTAPVVDTAAPATTPAPAAADTTKPAADTTKK